MAVNEQSIVQFRCNIPGCLAPGVLFKFDDDADAKVAFNEMVAFFEDIKEETRPTTVDCQAFSIFIKYEVGKDYGLKAVEEILPRDCLNSALLSDDCAGVFIRIRRYANIAQMEADSAHARVDQILIKDVRALLENPDFADWEDVLYKYQGNRECARRRTTSAGPRYPSIPQGQLARISVGREFGYRSGDRP